MTRLLIFGLGYTATRIADALRGRGWHVDATGSAGNLAFDDRTAVAQAELEDREQPAAYHRLAGC